MRPAIGIEVDGLRQFRADLRRAADATPKVLTEALKRAGEPIVNRLRSLPPHRSGRLARGYRIQVRSTVANVVNREPYAVGAEWGRHGKWRGFQRYGGPGRFGWRAVEERRDTLLEDVARELDEILTVYGWAT